MRFGNWTVGSLYRSWSLKIMAKRVGEIDWICCKYSEMGQRNTTQAEEYTFLFQLEKGNGNHQLETVFFVHQHLLAGVCHM